MEYCSILTSLGDYLLPAAGAPCPLPYFADAPNLFFDNLQRRRTRSRFCARNGKRNTKISQCPTRALLGAELCACVRHPAQIRRSLAHKRSAGKWKNSFRVSIANYWCSVPGVRCSVLGSRFSMHRSRVSRRVANRRTFGIFISSWWCLRATYGLLASSIWKREES